MGAVVAVLGWTCNSPAYDINDQFRIGGVFAGVWQYQTLHDAPGFENLGRGALTFQPEVGFTPTDQDELFAKLGFGARNGLMEEGRSPFILWPWAADLEDDCKNINSRGRDYLLTTWYKHTIRFSDEHTLGLTGGIIDATDYLDDNAFANDEFTQFMNQALTNAPHAFLPSYDVGAAVEWGISGFSLKGVAIVPGSNGWTGELDEPYNAYLLQAGYSLETGLGRGNYRFLLGMSSRAFPSPEGTGRERRRCAILSFDQELGDRLGAWVRFGWQDDAAAVDYKGIYSGGFNVSGRLWGREQDNIGIGYAHLNGGNRNVDHSHVFETYLRVALTEMVAITGDIQYMKDSYKNGGHDPSGWIFGLRATAEF